jgi:anti-sigma regulatory factor (Ser/Thr protein kinase)
MSPAPSDRLKLPAEIASVQPFCEFARAHAESAGLQAETLDKLDLIIEELIVNIATYAYDVPGAGDIEMACSVSGPGKLRVVVADRGRAFDPLASEPPDFSRGLAERPIGGLGIFLVKSITESLAYRRDHDQNVLTFEFASD